MQEILSRMKINEGKINMEWEKRYIAQSKTERDY